MALLLCCLLPPRAMWEKFSSRERRAENRPKKLNVKVCARFSSLLFNYRGDRFIVPRLWIRKFEQICNLREIERLSEQFYSLTARSVLSKF